MTGAIRGTNERIGRHHAFIGIHFLTRKYVYHIVLEKGVHTRLEEDALLSFYLYDLLVSHIKRIPIEFN